MRLIIHAVNVHQGGGKTLLKALLEDIPSELDTVVLLDSRLSLTKNIPENISIHRVQPTILKRVLAEWWLFRNSLSSDKIFCFGNLPPLFNLSGNTTVFIQNRYLVENITLAGTPIKVRLRIILERFWLFWRSRIVDEFVVQTPTMKRALRASTHVAIHVLPFYGITEDEYEAVNRNKHQKGPNQYDFVYVASGESHKNHRRLIDAWCLLADEGIFPALCLTIDSDSFPQLHDYISEQKQRYALKINNLGNVSHSRVLQLYSDTGALIYPSLMESYGLPLLEATQAGLPVVAAELDYVWDVARPVQTFDPNSTISIARSVKRYMGIDEARLLLTPREFIQHLIV